MPEQNRDYLGRFSSPFSGYSTRMTSRFGRRASPWGIGSTRHPGVDLSAGPGVSGYPAQSIAGGIVTHAGRMGGYGNLVEVEHENGYRSRYGHLQSIGVRVGDYIARGTPIGLVGSTGRSTGSHLHLEVRDPTGKAVNPRAFVDFTENVPTPTERPAPGPVESPPDSIMAAFGMDSQPPSTAALGALSALAGVSPNIDPSRFGGLSASIDPSRFGGLPSMPDPSRFGGMPAMGPSMPDPSRFGPPSMPDPARFGGMPSPASVSMPASPVGAMASAVGPGPSMPSAERFGYTPDIDPSRFAGMPSIPGASMPASPMGEYASAVGNPDQQISQGWAGNLMGVPASSVPTSSVDPAAMPSNMLAMSYAPPGINMGVPNTFQPGPDMTAALPEPNMPMAMPEQAPALPPPTTVANMPVAGIPAADQSMPMSMPSMPSLSAGDIYGGAFGSAYANDGSLVGRDEAGNTTVTNQYGATTATTPTGQQAAYMGPGGMNMPSIPGPARGLVGGLVGGAAGTAIAGPIGGLIGGLIGKTIATNAFGNSGYGSGFPTAPSTAGQRQGPALSQRDRDSISPAASRSMDRNGGRMTGLW